MIWLLKLNRVYVIHKIFFRGLKALWFKREHKKLDLQNSCGLDECRFLKPEGFALLRTDLNHVSGFRQIGFKLHHF